MVWNQANFSINFRSSSVPSSLPLKSRNFGPLYLYASGCQEVKMTLKRCHKNLIQDIFSSSSALGLYASGCQEVNIILKQCNKNMMQDVFYFFFRPGPLCLSMPQVAMIAMWSVQCLQRSESDYAQFDNHHHHHHHHHYNDESTL